MTYCKMLPIAYLGRDERAPVAATPSVHLGLHIGSFDAPRPHDEPRIA